MSGTTGTLFARVQNGVVVEFFTVPSGQSITQFFNPALIWAPVPAGTAVAVGWTATETNGVWSFAAPPPLPPPTPAQQAAAALAAGWQVQSVSTPAINGTYAMDPTSQQKIAALSLFIQVNNAFPAGMTTYAYPDINGTFHIFPTTALYQEFATAAANFVALLEMLAFGAPGAAIPAQPTTIS